MNVFDWIIPAVAAALLLPYLFALRPRARAVERERQRMDRLGLLTSGVAIVTILVVARQVGMWTTTLLPAWFALVVIAAAAIAGLVLRSRGLAWIRPGARPGLRIAGFALAVVAGGAVIGVLTVPGAA